MAAHIRLYVDFNTMMMDPLGRVTVAEIGSDRPDDQEALRVLKPDLPIVLYDETMEVEAVAVLDSAEGVWLAEPDWSTRHDLAYA